MTIPSDDIILIQKTKSSSKIYRQKRSKSMSSQQDKTTKNEFKKLKSLLPTLKRKQQSSQIEIVMETIRYIRELEEQLIDRFMDTETAITTTPTMTSSK